MAGLIEIALVIEGAQGNTLYVTGHVISDDFLFRESFKKHAHHKIIGDEYAFYVEERCFANLSRQHAINLCKMWLDRRQTHIIVEAK